MCHDTISKTVRDKSKVTINEMTNRKSRIRFWLASRSIAMEVGWMASVRHLQFVVLSNLFELFIAASQTVFWDLAVHLQVFPCGRSYLTCLIWFCSFYPRYAMPPECARPPLHTIHNNLRCKAGMCLGSRPVLPSNRLHYGACQS